MAIADKITSLTADLVKIRTKLVALGLATSTDGYDNCADAVAGIVNQGAVSGAVAEGETFTIPAGYHNGSGTVRGVGGGGDYTLQAKTGIVPSKQAQSITPDTGYYGLSSVTITAIPDAYQDVSGVTATAAEVLAGKTFVPANGTLTAGTMANNGKVNKILDVHTTAYNIDEGYHNGQGAVEIQLEEKTVTPSKTQQVITPTDGYVLEKVTVAAIDDKYIDASNCDATSAMLLAGKKAISWNPESQKAVEITGSMMNHGTIDAEIDGLTTTQYILPNGYISGGSVSLTDDIENALAALL